MSDYIAPLNLRYIFQNTLAGTPIVASALFMIFFSVLAGYFKMNGSTYLILFSLASIVLYEWFGGGLFMFVLFIGGLLIFKIISTLVKD